MRHETKPDYTLWRQVNDSKGESYKQWQSGWAVPPGKILDVLDTTSVPEKDQVRQILENGWQLIEGLTTIGGFVTGTGIAMTYDQPATPFPDALMEEVDRDKMIILKALQLEHSYFYDFTQLGIQKNEIVVLIKPGFGEDLYNHPTNGTKLHLQGQTGSNLDQLHRCLANMFTKDYIDSGVNPVINPSSAANSMLASIAHERGLGARTDIKVR